jgi:NACalpha-BTF3-like transcription factor
MALEEEIMNADQESAKEEVKSENKNFDDLTDEDIELVKECVAMP